VVIVIWGETASPTHPYLCTCTHLCTQRNFLLGETPVKYRLFSLGSGVPIQYKVSWAHKSLPKRHLDRFNRLCSVHQYAVCRHTETCYKLTKNHIISWSLVIRQNRWSTVVRAAFKYDEPEVENVALCPRVTFSTSGSSCLIVVWPTMSFFVVMWHSSLSNAELVGGRPCDITNIARSHDHASLQVILTDHH